MADYYVDLDGKVKKKKKKADYVVSQDGKIIENSDIAPISSAVKEKEKWYDGYFQKGSFSDGYQFGDLSRTVLGTVTDLNEDLSAGILGIGEKTVDAGAYVVGGVGGLFGQDKFQKNMQDFIAKDLYDEEKLSKSVFNPFRGVTAPILEMIEFADAYRSGNGKEALEDALNLKTVDSDKHSVLGTKSDSLAQSGGQLLGTIGLQAVGVPWWVTTGVTSFGGETEQAFNEGATYGEAGLSGVITAGSDILTEKLFGGSGLGEKGLINLEPLTKGISNKVVKTLADYGIDILAEGSEEVVASVFGRLGTSLYKEESIKELLTSEEAIDEYIQGFIGGAVLGGGMNSVKVGSSIQSGKDYRTGLTENETKVVEKEVENRVAEKEADGTKVSNKDKTAIREEVMNDLDKGYLNLDTIESELGGETYEAYKSLTEKENSLREEITKLESDPRPTAQNRLTEAKAELESIEKGTEKTELKDRLSLEVQELTKSERLSESYNERARKSQKFEADLTKYDTKVQETIKKATESGILNNTNRTHEFVDMVAKLSADKGVSFDFTNNENLKKSGFAIEGKTVNGLVKDNDIILNIDSSKALNTVVGHEITHVLEGTELYTELQNAVKQFATTKGEYQTRYDALKKLYEGVDGANIDNELTADLVGEYLFTDADFINNLSTTKPNVFKKIYDEIKYLYKVATAGSKEARELAKVKKAFDKAYKESGNADLDAKYSISEPKYQKAVEEGNLKKAQKMVEKTAKENGYDTFGFHGTDEGGFTVFDTKYSDDGISLFIAKNKETAQSYTSNYTDSEVDLNSGKVQEGLYHVGVKMNNPYVINAKGKNWNQLVNEKISSRYKMRVDMVKEGIDYKYLLTLTEEGVVDKGRFYEGDSKQKANIKEVKFDSVNDLVNALPDSMANSLKKSIGDNLTKREETSKKFYHALGQDKAKILSDTIDVNKNGERIGLHTTREWSKYAKQHGYDGVIVKDVWDSGKSSKDVKAERGDIYIAFDGNQIKSLNPVTYDNNGNVIPLSERFDSSKKDIRYSLTEDTKGRSLTAEQQEYFKDSAVRDEDGKLRVVYHGTSKGGHTVFDSWGKGKFGLFGIGTYTTEDKSVAESYTKKGKGDSPMVYEMYANITNPLDMDADADISKWKSATNGEVDFSDVKTNEDAFKVLKEYCADNEMVRWEAEEYILDVIQYNMGYDGITHIGGGRFNSQDTNRHRVWIAFESEQLKNVDNTKPTTDVDIRYSLSETPLEERVSGDDLLDAQDLIAEIENVAEISPNGYVTLYHRTTEDSAKKIRESGKMSAKEDGIFFSTKKEGENAVGYGNGVVELKVPIEKLVLDDIFSDEAHLKIPLKNRNQIIDVSNYLVETKHSLGDQTAPIGNYNVYGKDIALEKNSTETRQELETAPVQEVVAENTTTKETTNHILETTEMVDEYAPIKDASEIDAQQSDRLYSLDESQMPDEAEVPYYESEDVKLDDPFIERDIKDVGKRNVNAYMYDNPEVKPYFQEEAQNMLWELKNSVKGEKSFNDQLYYDTNGEQGWFGTKRETSSDIAYLLDNYNYTYADIEKGLNAIIEDHGAENNAISKRIEFAINDRLKDGYTDFMSGSHIPANQDYVNLLMDKQINTYSDEAYNQYLESLAQEYGNQDIAPVRQQYEAIEPAPQNLEAQEQEWANNKMARVKDPNTVKPHKVEAKQRKWTETSTESEVVNREILPDDLDLSKIVYEPIPNKVTLGKANAKLGTLGYDEALTYFNSQLAGKKASLEDIALGERLLQEAMKKGDKVTAGELIQNISILGTELGQKVQALSIIQRLTPEGQLKMLHKTVNRGKVKGDKAFEGVELTQEMIDHILKTYKPDGTFDQNELNKAVEDVKKKIAKEMKVTAIDKVNAWRYLSMLGNPKTHIRNVVSNVAMKGTVAVKNVLARTIEDIAPIKNKSKTWKRATDEVKKFAEKTTLEAKEVISDNAKYSEESSIKSKRDIFKNKILNKLYEFNNDLMEKEDWWFSKSAYKNSLSEYLTANGIKTSKDIENNPKIVEKAKQYALEQSQIATFRQYSWLANQIRNIESKNAVTEVAVGSILPFKKTPINIAKAGLSYSPLGFAKSLTYDLYQMKQGKMEASKVVDNLSQGVTGSALTLVGYMLAMSGLLSGGGDDDKEGKYDYQLGKQAYSINFGGNSYSLSWLSPVAMPLFVGANAYEQLVEGEEWNGDVVMETLAQTLDPLSEMSFLSSLDSVLSSYDSGVEKFAGIGETMLQSYLGQFVPTLSSQVANVMDDKKRSTKVAGDSGFKIVDETINKLKFKIPFLRETLEPTTDIWGNEVKQSEDMIERALETFIAPYSRKENIATEIDAEIKDLYAQTGDNGLIPSIPYNYVNFSGEKYKMSAKEYTDFKKNYGQTANDLLEDLFNTTTYQNATSEDKAELVNKVYDYARDEAKREYLGKEGVEYTNATQDGTKYYKEGAIKGAIENDMSLDEFDLFSKDRGEYYVSKAIGGYELYDTYKKAMNDIEGDKDENGNTINGSKKKYIESYINGLPLDYGQKILLFTSKYPKDDTYKTDLVEYLNGRSDITYEEMKTILEDLDYTVEEDGTVRW